MQSAKTGYDHANQRSVILTALLIVTVTTPFYFVLGDEPKAQQVKVVDLFKKEVVPALSAKCVACHRPDNLKGGLDLTTLATTLKGGDSGTALVKGKPLESSLYTRTISHQGARPEMPAKGEPLTDQEAKSLRDWIAADAPWPNDVTIKEPAKATGDFWSFQPIRKPQVPIIAHSGSNTSRQSTLDAWAKIPIDAFILQELNERKLAPNSPALPRDFIRRATYDLTGLPPTPEEVSAFERECPNGLTDAAVSALIERLLARPQYGEQWGRHWLDVIRFGESRGYERNEIITNLWPFRDYVIRSINEDKPFDRFIHEHLAGDVIGRDQPDIEIGSAFLVAGPYDDVGNQDPVAAAQIRADQMDEIIRATSESFLGLTIGCCRCHDHKFDPLATADYYSLYATFAGTVHGQREVATPLDRKRRQELLAPLQAKRQQLVTERDTFEKGLADRSRQRVAAALKSWTRPKASRYGTEETFPAITAQYVRLSVQGSDAPNGQGMFQLDEFEVWSADAKPQNVALSQLGAVAQGASRSPAKDFTSAYSVELVNDGKFGERWHPAGHELVIKLAKPTSISRVYFSVDRGKALGEDHFMTTFVGEYELAVSNDGKTWTSVASSANRIPATEALKQARLVKLEATPQDLARRKVLNDEIAAVDARIAGVPALPVWWIGTHQPAPGPFHVFVGGDPQRKGAPVHASGLQVLGNLKSHFQLKPEQPETERRLALARWLTASDNPLPARILANRIWHYHFGTGIVDTPSDFGFMGSRPTHPKLLDWLALQLVDHGWRLKPMHRLIMNSQTYRQSAAWRADASAIDADSRYLWRFPPRRLRAEEIRDSMLSVAGKLNLQMGGPGFRLYDYLQDNVATYVPLDRPGPETYRRAVYHHNARSARVDVMTDFDCPDPAFAEPRRANTVTPIQALTLMNHQFSLDMTQALVERLEREAPTVPARINLAYRLMFSRGPEPNELSAAEQLIGKHGLRPFCRALLNANEFIHCQ